MGKAAMAKFLFQISFHQKAGTKTLTKGAIYFGQSAPKALVFSGR